MKVARWGDSLAVPIPENIAEALQIKEGDEVDLLAHGSAELSMVKETSGSDLLERVRSYRGRMPIGFTFDRSAIYDRD